MEQKEIVAEEKVIDKSTGVGILIVDQRQVYMAKLLEERGYRLITWDLREGQMPRGKDPIWCAGVLILPVPVSRVQDLARLEQCLIMHRYDIKMCIGGAFPQELKELLDQYEIPWMDVLTDSGVAMKNAIATAEGCIAELSRLMPVNIEDANIIVMGFGNCGKPIAEKLYCMGAHVSVVARSKKPYPWRITLALWIIPWMQPFHTQRQMPSSIRSRHLLSQKRRSIFYMRMRSC